MAARISNAASAHAHRARPLARICQPRVYLLPPRRSQRQFVRGRKRREQRSPRYLCLRTAETTVAGALEEVPGFWLRGLFQVAEQPGGPRSALQEPIELPYGKKVKRFGAKRQVRRKWSGRADDHRNFLVTDRPEPNTRFRNLPAMV